MKKKCYVIFETYCELIQILHLKGPQVRPTPGFMMLPFEKYATIIEMYFLYSYYLLYNILLLSNCYLIFHPSNLSHSIIYCMFLYGIKSSLIKSIPLPENGIHWITSGLMRTR